MAGKGVLRIKVVGDDSGLQKTLGETSASVGKFGAGLGKIGFGALAGGALAVGAAFAGLSAVSIKTAGDLGKIEALNAQTEAALKSTGAAAWVARSDIENLAGGIEKLTGIEAETVQAGENLLLTFTNIQNKAGDGNNIFERATQVMTDMSVALGQDTTASAIQLGKALNDPVKGVTALQKVGVSFTESQKATITKMVETGDVLGAQKVILAELNKEFGGSAEAFGTTLPGQVAKLKNSFGDLMEPLVQKAIPALTDFLGFVRENMPLLTPILDKVFEGMKVAGEYITYTVLPFVKDAIASFAGWLASDEGQGVINGAWATIQEVLRVLWDFAVNKAWPEIRGAIAAVKEWLSENEPVISAVFGAIKTVLEGLWDVAVNKVWPEIKQAIAEVFGWVSDNKQSFLDIFAAIHDVMVGPDGKGGLKAAFETAWPAISKALDIAWNVGGAAMKPTLQLIKESIEGISTVLETLRKAWEKLFGSGGNDKGILGGAASWIGGLFGKGGGGLSQAEMEALIGGGLGAFGGQDTGGLKPQTKMLWGALKGRFPTANLISGYRANDPYPDHPSGTAIDIAAYGAYGTAIKDWAISQPMVRYALWQQRSWSASGSRAMADRGSPTQNHFDHVHIRTYRAGGLVAGAGAVPVIAHAGERILTERQTRAFERLVEALAGSGGGRPVRGDVTINVQGEQGLGFARTIATAIGSL